MGVPAVELKGITKTFGSIVANSDCSLTVEKGEILSVLGENGSNTCQVTALIDGGKSVVVVGQTLGVSSGAGGVAELHIGVLLWQPQ